jgi:hypothetical protein
MGRRKKVTEPESKRYMLFLYGDFTESEELTSELSTQFVGLVSSEYLKFTYGEYGVVLHFRSNEVFSDLKEYIDMGMSEITEQYFLMEVTKNVDIKMPRKLKKDFLNIDGEEKKKENKTGEINVESKLRERKEELRNFTFEFLIPTDFNQMVQTNEPDYLPTVDEILDKISENGIESLTEKEKEILDNYGKRKDGGH